MSFNIIRRNGYGDTYKHCHMTEFSYPMSSCLPTLTDGLKVCWKSYFFWNMAQELYLNHGGGGVWGKIQTGYQLWIHGDRHHQETLLLQTCLCKPQELIHKECSKVHCFKTADLGAMRSDRARPCSLLCPLKQMLHEQLQCSPFFSHGLLWWGRKSTFLSFITGWGKADGKSHLSLHPLPPSPHVPMHTGTNEPIPSAASSVRCFPEPHLASWVSKHRC